MGLHYKPIWSAWPSQSFTNRPLARVKFFRLELNLRSQVSESSSARIGFNILDDTEASPNLIQNNKEDGIVVTRSSSARIVGNTISGNTENGVLITRVSHGDVSSNTINSNGGDGIFVSRNSGVNLGEDTGSGIFDSPNSTNSNNVGVGIRCAINSYGDGRIGTLNGASGPFSFVANCVNATSP